jgi:flagellin
MTTTTSTFPLLMPMNGVGVATQAQSLAAQGQVESYLYQVDAATGVIGAAMGRFEAAVRLLRGSSEEFRKAESRIVDVDVADELSVLTSESIRRNAAISVLASATSQPLLALQLLSTTGQHA